MRTLYFGALVLEFNVLPYSVLSASLGIAGLLV